MNKCRNPIEPVNRWLHRKAAYAEVAGHHALAGHRFKEPEDLLAFAKGVEEYREGANIHGVGAEPDEMRVQPAQLGEQHANPLRALGDFEVEEFFDGQAIAEVIRKRIEVIDAVGERNHLLIELGLAGFLDAGVQIAYLRADADDDFTVELDHQPQHTMGRRVLRAHIEDHAPFAGAFGSGQFEDGRARNLDHQRYPSTG